MIQQKSIGVLVALICGALFFLAMKPEWGFFGHQRINRLAVFTLPPEMIVFYKKNIDFITEHAVDPDKRRYASRLEGFRHYIDLDRYGAPPFPDLPRDWVEVLMQYTDIYLIRNETDSILLSGKSAASWSDKTLTLKGKGVNYLLGKDSVQLDRKAYKRFFIHNIMPLYYDEEWPVSNDSLAALLGVEHRPERWMKSLAVDRFSLHGMLPYHLSTMLHRLTEAFRNKDEKLILKYSADFGHYIGDAHVPLHTTENYNGQLTNQIGIHAFWESRLPELYADETYDYYVGKSRYIQNPEKYFWDIVMKSHTYVDSVLLIEKSLSNEFPPDRQFCFDQRLGQTVRTQCRDYCEAYHKRMDGMVESRMREAILAVGNLWYTAWVDAGQPDLSKLGLPLWTQEEQKQYEKENQLSKEGKMLGRPEE